MYEKQRVELVNLLRKQGITNRKVLSAIAALPRELFVPEHEIERAYDNTALSIEAGQTISQPFTIARFIEVLEEKVKAPRAHILDVGAGSGYETAILARIYDKVTGVEIIPELAQKASERLQELKITNAHIRTGNAAGILFPDESFDGVKIAAATQEIPQAIIQETKTGGTIVAPIGTVGNAILTRYTKTLHGLEKETFERYVFVPLVHA